jgi:hypothetical protein
MRIGNVPESIITDDDYILYGRGEAPKKVLYSKLKSNMLGDTDLTTTAEEVKESINEINQVLLDSIGYGVINGGEVTAQSTPNMTVSVTDCILRTAKGGRQVVTGNNALAISSADAANPRIDIVYIDSVGNLEYLTGLPAQTPVAHTLPSNSFLLYEIHVSVNAIAITNNDIVDKRMILNTMEIANNLEKAMNDIKNITNNLNITNTNVSQISNLNLLINGDFQVWQRGTSFTSSSTNAYAADRWLCASISNIGISKIDTGGVRLTNTTAFTSNCRFHQYIEVPKSLQGKTVTLSVSMKSSASGKVAALSIASYDRQTIYKSKVIALTTTSTVYSVTATLPVGQDTIFIGLALSTDTSDYIGLISPTTFPVCTIDIDWFKLEQGLIVTPFVSRLYGEELALCQRYYELCGLTRIVCPAGTRSDCNIIYKVSKRITPTLYISPNTSNDLNKVKRESDSVLASITIYEKSQNSFGIVDVLNANAGDTYVFVWSADAEIY